MEQTPPLPPLVSDEQMKGYREDMSLGERLEAQDLTAYAVRRIYEADRAKTREVVQALVDALWAEMDATPPAFRSSVDALALAKSQLNIEPTKP